MVKCDFAGMDLVLFNISFNILDDRMDMITLITITDTRLTRRVHTLEDRMKIQANIEKLEKRSGKSKSKKVSCEVLCSSKNNQPHKHKLRDDCLTVTF